MICFPPVLWWLPVRASGTGARGVPVSNRSPVCHSPRKPLQDITIGTVGSAKIERIWLSLEHLKIQASGLLTQLSSKILISHGRAGLQRSHGLVPNGTRNEYKDLLFCS